MSRLFLGLAALTLLSACGIQGDLERPDPLWNSARAIQTECARERAHHEDLDHRCNPPAASTATPQATTTPNPANPAGVPDSSTTTTTTTP